MTDVVRLKYGYDRAGNRLFRRDEVARSQTPLAKYDEPYGYDGLDRLSTQMEMTLGLATAYGESSVI